MEEFLKNIAHLFGSEILGLKVYQFQPYGLSALMIMPESHIAIHTWPEYQFASLDIFLQAGSDPNQSIPLIQDCFHPKDVKIIELERGMNS
jgi:S-adenosylmethionine decarboxylase proenzyme